MKKIFLLSLALMVFNMQSCMSAQKEKDFYEERIINLIEYYSLTRAPRGYNDAVQYLKDNRRHFAPHVFEEKNKILNDLRAEQRATNKECCTIQ